MALSDQDEPDKEISHPGTRTWYGVTAIIIPEFQDLELRAWYWLHENLYFIHLVYLRFASQY